MTVRQFLLLLVLTRTSQGYITSHGALPVHRQKQWLRSLTQDLCQVKPGELSVDQLSQAPELMFAWSNTKVDGKENALAVESLVKRVIDERRAGNPQATDLTVDDYNCLLEGWAKSGQGSAAAERAEQILTQMQTQGPLPNLSSFKAVLMAWRQAAYYNSNNDRTTKKTSSSPLSENYIPHRSQRILELMIRLYRNSENTQALPDADCFDIVLQTWSRSGHPRAPHQAEQILGVMERLYESTGLLKLKPRTTSFNAVLAAWSKSGDNKAADRASDILSFMELLEGRGDETVSPDTASYSTVIGALTHSRDQGLAARKASAFLRHVEASYEMKKSENLVPDTILFNMVMGSWAKSNVSGAYRKARSILDRQISLYKDGCHRSKPDVYGYTSVIASCAAERGNKKEKEKAFEVALATFQELQHDEEGPNHVTYGAMLKACARLLPSSSPTRRKWARKIFKQCCEAGYVGDMVLSRFREAASPDIYKELMQGYKRREIPKAWSCNVNETNNYRRKRSKPKRKRAEV